MNECNRLLLKPLFSLFYQLATFYMKDTLEIYYDKSKLQIPLLIISAILVFIPFEVNDLLFKFFNHSSKFIKFFLPFVGLGLVAIAIPYYYNFLTFRFWLNRYTQKKPVLMVGKTGITEKIDFGSIGFIPWSNIQKIDSISSRGHHLVLTVKNKEEIINKFKNNKKRKKIEADFKKYGDKVLIPVKYLGVNIYSLKKYSQKKLDESNSSIHCL